jgi:hypothetical protein
MKRQLVYLSFWLIATTAFSAGQLTNTVTQGHSSDCPNTQPNNMTTYSNWTYTDSSGVGHTFNGNTIVERQLTWYQQFGHTIVKLQCGANLTTSLNAYATDYLYYLRASGGNGTETLIGYAGYINPKYKIVGVMYSPPGSASSVTYGQNTVMGSSTQSSGSFATGVEQSISVSSGSGIFGFSTKKTQTYSNSYTQESDSSSSIAISQTTSIQNGLKGYSDPVNGLNHDYDYIGIWLNPLLSFTLYTDQTTGNNAAMWTGFSYDLNDSQDYPDMDLIWIQLGCLNGNFYQQYANNSNTNWLTCTDIFNNNLSRTWALPSNDGSSPALTPTLADSSAPYDFCQQQGTDLYYVCQADPFANSNYGQQEFPPPIGSFTTADGRFTACNNSNCTTTINYLPNQFTIYNQGYSTTATGSQGYKNTYQTKYSIEEQFGFSSGQCQKFCVSFSVDTNNSTTYTVVDQFNKTTNNSNGQTASFTINGPPEGYAGPTQFVIYQDNAYGTFMFYPGN